MLDNHTFELINAGIDQELRADEAEQLDTILESSADARAVRAELLRMTNTLNALPDLTPPADLSQKILDQIKMPSRPATFSLRNLFSSFQPAAAGLAFAAGILITAGVYELLPQHTSESDLANMVGTMVTGKTEATARQLDAFSIQESGLTGSVSLREAMGVLVLDFSLESAQRVEIKLALAEAGLSFAGIAQAASLPENVNESYLVSGGTLSVVNQGRQTFTVFLRNSATEESSEEINIEFSSDGERVFHGILRG